MEMAPMKLQKDEIRPVTKRARSTGKTASEHNWNNTNITTALVYRCSPPKE